jgi:Mrp family chromosome partitioning ATPase
MGRMLEALKRTEEIKPISEPALEAPRHEPATQEAAEDEMPYIEVGGPRPQTQPTPRLEMPSPRAATLRVRSPQGVTLQPCQQAAAPRTRIAAELVAFHQPNHTVTQQYAALFDQLAAEPVEDIGPAFLFTSLAPGAGTTTSLLNLAIAGCQKHDTRIVVVDANYLRPAAAARLGVGASAGLADVLQGKIAIQQAIQQTAIKNLQVLPAGAINEVGESIRDAMRWIMAWLQQRFDVVLIDAPAWDNADSLKALLPTASAVYLVVDATETEQPAVRSLTREVARQGSRLGGLIVTQ